MLEPFDDFNEFYIDVEIKNPRPEGGSYISYEIAIETNNSSFTHPISAVRRRYSEFVLLRKLLVKEFSAWKLPPLPPKFPFKNHFDVAFVEKRRKGLEQFIKGLVSQKIFLSSKALHLFLQSCHPMSEIHIIIQRKSSPVQSYDNRFTNERFPNSTCVSIADDSSTLSLSSHTDMNGSYNSVPAESSVVHSTTTVTAIHSSSESKKVSFCDQVTVAQIVID